MSNNIIRENDIHGNHFGINIYDNSDNNCIYHNNFTNNLQNAYDECVNNWDNGYSDPFYPQTDGGNYWYNHIGFDFYKGPNQDILGRDGILDRPYNIPGGSNKDRYPLKKPYDGQISKSISQSSQQDSQFQNQNSQNKVVAKVLVNQLLKRILYIIKDYKNLE